MGGRNAGEGAAFQALQPGLTVKISTEQRSGTKIMHRPLVSPSPPYEGEDTVPQRRKILPKVSLAERAEPAIKPRAGQVR